MEELNIEQQKQELFEIIKEKIQKIKELNEEIENQPLFWRSMFRGKLFDALTAWENDNEANSNLARRQTQLSSNEETLLEKLIEYCSLEGDEEAIAFPIVKQMSQAFEEMERKFNSGERDLSKEADAFVRTFKDQRFDAKESDLLEDVDDSLKRDINDWHQNKHDWKLAILKQRLDKVLISLDKKAKQKQQELFPEEMPS